MILQGDCIDRANFATLQFFQAGEENYNKIFWVKTVCATAQLGMMVWSARARCFVAGTPVVIDYAPQIGSGEFMASTNADMDLSWLDWIGIAAIGVGVVVSLRNRERKPQFVRGQRRLLPLHPESLVPDPPLPEVPSGHSDDHGHHLEIDSMLSDVVYDLSFPASPTVGGSVPDPQPVSVTKPDDVQRGNLSATKRLSLAVMLPMLLGFLCFSPRLGCCKLFYRCFIAKRRFSVLLPCRRSHVWKSLLYRDFRTPIRSFVSRKPMTNSHEPIQASSRLSELASRRSDS